MLQDDVRRVKRDLEKSSAEREDILSKIETLELHNDSSGRELKKIVSDKQVSAAAHTCRPDLW